MILCGHKAWTLSHLKLKLLIVQEEGMARCVFVLVNLNAEVVLFFLSFLIDEVSFRRLFGSLYAAIFLHRLDLKFPGLLVELP